ncbi:TonB-dependent receptor, putative [Methylophaga frappieri]|uniref:TonB-dependent receptor, putative n=1 Tax=Methylophaga frappieri (strain ATCC BAA-2434 / DSM 25690 / JAM7) TaxID=754477 RepID=I1YL08_METFJ|nr:TonB-dependent receptor [Methylophaga frappieri]AFJ03601.1 TonB-dependent receptor, putative [Methylophaga frappieri]
MFIQRSLLGLMIGSALSGMANANTELDQIVVTATRTPTSLDQIGSAVSVITAEDIQQRQFITLSDALKDLPGMHVVASGNRGSQTSLFIRGSNSNHTLVLVDGIEMNDPSSPNGGFDFANFLLDDVQSIEVVRGSQSVLYGSDAIGGVVHVRTKSGSGKLQARAKAEIGTHSTHHEMLAVSGSVNDFSYALTGGFFESDGDSIATRKRLAPGSDRDDDGYQNGILSTRLGWQPTDKLNFDFSARLIETENDLDGGFDFSGNTAEDPDAINKSRQLFLGGSINGNFWQGAWRPTLSWQRSDIERKNRNDRIDPFGTLDRTDYRGQKNKLGLQNDLHLLDNHLITIGGEYETEKLTADGMTDFGGFIQTQQSSEEQSTRAFYIQDQIQLSDALTTTLGLRHDDPDSFGSETTYRATLSYQLSDQTRLRGGVGSGFKTPSLYELYGFTPSNFGSAYRGNPDLKPETSDNWEIGIDQQFWNQRLSTSLTYFQNDIDDLITTVFLPSFDSTSVNENEAELEGLEAEFSLAATDTLDVDVNYTYTRSVNEDDRQLLRRPRHKAGLLLTWQPSQPLVFTGNLQYVGPRKDVDGVGARINRGGYSVVHVTGSYQVNSQWRLFGRVENATDHNFEPAYGFQAAGVTAMIGTEIKL